MKLLDVFLIATAGYIIGVLRERWSYFYKTGHHLQDLKKCQHKNIKREDGLDECLDCGVKNY